MKHIFTFKQFVNESLNKIRICTYLGSCVNVGTSSNYPICDYFSDATEMAQIVGNPDTDEKSGRSTPITREQFLNLDFVNVPKKIQKVITKALTHIGDEDIVQIEYVSNVIEYDRNGSFEKPYTFEESGFFWIYDVSADIHYFFKMKY